MRFWYVTTKYSKASTSPATTRERISDSSSIFAARSSTLTDPAACLEGLSWRAWLLAPENVRTGASAVPLTPIGRAFLSHGLRHIRLWGMRIARRTAQRLQGLAKALESSQSTILRRSQRTARTARAEGGSG